MKFRTLVAISIVVVCGELAGGCVSSRMGQARRDKPGTALAPVQLSFSDLVTPSQLVVEVASGETGNKMILPFFEMATVESQHDPFAVGDGGRAIGVYQIHRSYWKDSRVPGRWEDCRDPAYSQRVVLAYWNRYCPDALRNGDLEVLCRVHNGGPQGHKKRQTMSYWRKIQAVSAEIGLGQLTLADARMTFP